MIMELLTEDTQLNKVFEEKMYTSPVSQRIFIDGMEYCKEILLKQALDAEIASTGCFIPLVSVKYIEKMKDIHLGDRIKVIIFKED